MPLPKSFGLSKGWPAGGGIVTSTAATVTLGPLSLSVSLQVGVSASGTISGATPGSTIVSNIPGVTVNSSARTFSGTPTGSGQTVANGLVETLAGATNTPRATAVVIAAAAGAAALTSIDAEGWKGPYAFALPTYSQTVSEFAPDTAPVTVTGTSQGFDATGTPNTPAITRVVTKIVRLPWSATGDQVKPSTRVALSDIVYAGDVLPGVTNNSTVASPAPVANWSSTDRRIIDGSLPIELVAFHRDGIACVVFSATDGTNTVTATSASMTVLGHSGDLNAVLGYAATLNTSTLTAGQITVNAKLYPKLGTTILDSATSPQRNFVPQLYLKNVALAAARPYAYLAGTGTTLTAGNDATGVVSTNTATAAASPFATLRGLLEAAKTQLGTGNLDGLIIRVNGTGTGLTSGVTTGVYQTLGEIIIERDPNVTRANASITFGAAAANSRLNFIHYRDISMVRAGAFGLPSTARSVLENVTLDNASQSAALISGGTLSIMGLTVANNGSSTFAAGGTETAMARGLSVGGGTIEGYLVLGCNMNASVAYNAARSTSNGIVAFNYFTKAGTVIGVDSTDVSGFALVQNVFEFIASASNPIVRPSGDGATANITHWIQWNNTFAGYRDFGRENMLYNESNGVLRTHTLHSFKGNIHVVLYTKHDWFCGGQGIANPELHVGGWSFMYGVGSAGELTQWAVSSGVGANGPGGDRSVAYPGLSSKSNTSDTVQLDPMFTNYQGTTFAGAAGAGGGTYTIASGSPAKGMVPVSVLPFDLAGNARPATNSSAGAYQ